MSEGKKPIVMCWEKERVAAAVDLPERLFSPDGRVFGIRKWQPCVSIDGPVTATIEVIVEVPDPKSKEAVE